MEPTSQSYFLIALIAYLIGSIPFGLILVKIAGAGNLREIGSGNIGATNVLRTGRKGIAVATLLLDCGKGAAIVLVAKLYGIDFALLAGFFSVFGHVFPIWLKFRGGKGVATAIGALLANAWEIGLLVIGVWLIIAAVFRFSSLAAIIALLSSIIYSWCFADFNVFIMTLLIASLSILRHLENIRRLAKGKESKINLRGI